VYWCLGYIIFKKRLVETVESWGKIEKMEIKRMEGNDEGNSKTLLSCSPVSSRKISSIPCLLSTRVA